MNSKFIPSKGDFFYITFKPQTRVISAGLFSDVAEKVIQQQDRSHSGKVFECIGRDDHALIGIKPSGDGYKYTFVLSEVMFFPVGPEVIQALGIVEATQGGNEP